MKSNSFKNLTVKKEISIQHLQLRISLLFVGVIVILAGTISTVITEKSIQEMHNKVMELMSVNNRQRINNLNAFLEKTENTAGLFFSDDGYCEYDATAEDMDEFDKIQAENRIVERIQDLAVLENYTDFGVVYRNDKCLGWLSNNTMKAFPDGGLFDYLELQISNKKEQSGWFFDFDKSNDRIYYIKSLNDNAILITAYYSRELSKAFTTNYSSAEEIEVALIDDRNLVVYSTSQELNVGEDLTGRFGIRHSGQGKIKGITEGKVMVAGSCDNGFTVLTFCEEAEMFKEIESLKRFSLGITFVLVLVMIVIGSVAMFKLANPVGGVINELSRQASRDRLTNLINKITFEDMINNSIQDSKVTDYHVLIMLDLDNFKKVNDNFGHMAGDQVLIQVAQLFTRVFPRYADIGRLGGDEFAVYFKTGKELYEIKPQFDEIFQELLREFHAIFDERYAHIGFAISIGISTMEKRQAENYDVLYKAADKALYVAKQSGKNQWKWYEG